MLRTGVTHSPRRRDSRSDIAPNPLPRSMPAASLQSVDPERMVALLNRRLNVLSEQYDTLVCAKEEASRKYKADYKKWKAFKTWVFKKTAGDKPKEDSLRTVIGLRRGDEAAQIGSPIARSLHPRSRQSHSPSISPRQQPPFSRKLDESLDYWRGDLYSEFVKSLLGERVMIRALQCRNYILPETQSETRNRYQELERVQ